MKRCPKCGETKPFTEYHRNRSNKDGLSSECKACACARTKSYNDLHRSEINAKRRTTVYKLKGRKLKPGDGLKYCPGCDSVLPVDNFYEDAHRYDRRAAICRECSRKRGREYYPRSNWRGKYLLRVYGITETEYDSLFTAQNGVCKICGNPQQPRKRSCGLLAVDHDHTTGAIRGLLCDKCNRGLGHFDDSPDLLARAIEYVTRSCSASDCSA